MDEAPTLMPAEAEAGRSLTCARTCPLCFPQIATANKLNNLSFKGLFFHEKGGGNR
jgi:hypothetical protein